MTGTDGIELLSGTALSREQRASAPDDNDVLLLSEPGLNRPDAFFYQSKHVTYGSLCKNIYSGISAGIGLGGMAFQDKDAYSRSGHQHYPAYVNAEYRPNYVRDYALSEDDDSVKVLGHIVIDGRSYDMCVPKIDQSEAEVAGPPIGTLKFMALPSLAEIDEASPGFDGWTYPDGRLVSKASFPSAYAAFGPTERDTLTMFALPTLSDFIELNPYVQPHDAFRSEPPVVGMAQHSHPVTDIQVEGQVEFDFSMRAYQWGDQYGTDEHNPLENAFEHHHAANMNASNRLFYQPIVSIGASDLKVHIAGVSDCAGVDGENYPRHNLLPVLMYIGRAET